MDEIPVTKLVTPPRESSKARPRLMNRVLPQREVLEFNGRQNNSATCVLFIVGFFQEVAPWAAISFARCVTLMKRGGCSVLYNVCTGPKAWLNFHSAGQAVATTARGGCAHNLRLQLLANWLYSHPLQNKPETATTPHTTHKKLVKEPQSMPALSTLHPPPYHLKFC